MAAFDTAFHAHLPMAAATYALPREWRERWVLRRFGFHGLSHAYASRRVSELMERDPRSLRMVTCHLGSGASLAAVRQGVSVDTTMGFTPLEGLVMGTRSGTVDPGLILWLEEHTGMPPSELAAALEHRSGLLGLAGTADLREVLAAEARGDTDAMLAVGVYLHRLRAGIAGMVAALGGLDAIAFTGGVGENSEAIRSRAADGLGFLGIALDPRKEPVGGAGPGDRIGDGARPCLRPPGPGGSGDRPGGGARARPGRVRAAGPPRCGLPRRDRERGRPGCAGGPAGTRTVDGPPSAADPPRGSDRHGVQEGGG
ncbi:Acetate and butyrate kinase, partial [mine drainage metagenome]